MALQTSLFILTAIAVGMLMPIQAGFNAELSKTLNHSFHGAFVSFLIGTISLAISLLFIKDNLSLKGIKSLPPIYLTGGVLGALFVLSSLFLITRIGSTVLMTSFVIGQLIMSLFVDQYGWFGVPISPISFTKILGCFLLIIGLMLIIKN